MPFTKYFTKNNAQGIVISDTSSAITFEAGHSFPTDVSSGPYLITMNPPSGEIVKVTAASQDVSGILTVTVSREQEGSNYLDHSSGTHAYMLFTAGQFNDIADHVELHIAKLGLMDVTSSVNLNTMYSDIQVNNAKISFDSTSSSKLAGIEAGAEANTVDSVNSKTGAVTLVTGDISDTTSTQKYATAAEKTKLGYISVTQAVDLDTMESNIATNNAKITNADHSGDVTGSSALTIVPAAISGKTGVTPVSGDYVLLWDATDSALKKADASNFLAGAVTSVNSKVGIVTLVTGDISDTTSTQKYATAAEKTKLGYISVTQAVDLDTMESNISTNNAKVTNANHTGDVTGADALGIVPAAISGKTSVTAVSGDYVLLWDATDSALKKANVADFIGGGAVDSVNGKTGVVTLVTGDISDTTSTQKFATAAQLAKVDYLSVTQAVDLDTMESNIATNNAKVTNADHSGDVTGATALAIVPAAISGKTSVTAVSGDYVLLWDATDSALKKANVSDFIGGGAVDSVNGKTGVVTLVTGDISDTTSTQKFATSAQLAKVDHLTVTQAVDLDTLESNVTTNNAKVTNANHTGDVTGSAALAIVPAAISGKTGVTPVSGDYVLLWDATDSALKKADVTSFLDGGVTSVNSKTGAVTLVTGDISDTTSTQKFATAAEKTKLGFISVTQAVDLDTMESNIATNNAKVTNANHSGDVTGADVLGIVPAAISGKTGVTPAAGDYVLLWDATDSLLKKSLVDTFINGAAGDVTGPASSTDNGVAIYNGTGGKTIKNSLVTIDTSSVNIPGFLTVTGQARHSTQTALTTSGTATWNINNNPKANLLLAGDITSLIISGINLNSEATLYIKQHASTPYTVSWPAGIIWAGDTAPDLSTVGSNHIVSFFSYDGTGLYGSHVSDDVVAGGGAVDSVNGKTGVVVLVTGDISDTTSTQKYATAAQLAKVDYLTVTQAVDLDTMESNIATNNAKVTNATHTGDVTGADVLGIVPAAISGKTGVTPVAGDYVLLWDATDSLLKKADVSTFVNGTYGDVTGPASSTNTGVAIFNGTDGKTIMNSAVTIDTSSVAIPGFLSMTGQARHTTQTALSTSGTVAWDVNNNPKANIILSGDVTSLTVSGININTSAVLYVQQHAVSPKTITWPATIKWSGNNTPNISGLSSISVFSFFSYDGTNLMGTHITDQTTSIVSNATHTGEVTGATALTIDPTAISGKTGVTPVSGDYVLLWDATDSLLKKADASNFLGGAVSSVNGMTGAVTLVTGDISDTTSTQKYATAAEKTKLGYISVTQAVDLDTIESDTSTNNSKVSNATHTGEVTGSTLLTMDPTAVSNKTEVTPVSGDFLLLWDLTDSALKKVNASNFLGSAVASVNGFTGAVTLVTGNISDTTSAQKYVTATDITKLSYISVTQAVDLDTMESNITTNNAKVTNANHTGDVTGADVLGIVPAAISGRTGVTAVAGDYVLLWDATDSALKKADVTDFISPITATSTTTFTNKRMTKRVTTLTDAATIAINCDNMDMGKVTLTASRTLGTPTGTPTDGQPLLLEVVQGGSGSYTLTPDSTSTVGSYRFGSDVASFTLSTAVGKKDLILLTYLSDITGWAVASISKGYPA